MIKALFKFDKNIPQDAVIVDTTSNSGDFRELSPFVLRVPFRGMSVIFENLWQFSKVYKNQVLSIDGYPDASWYKWSEKGMALDRAVRYPMGKGAVPLYSFWDGEKLGYIEARKKIYAPIYAESVDKTGAAYRLEGLYSNCLNTGKDLILLDYDAYDYEALNMTLKDVINNPNRKMGHAFVLMMMLLGILGDCVR